MDVALIAPDAMLEWTQRGDIHFVLSRILEVPSSQEFYAKETKYKMLDNGVYELGFPVPTEEIMKLVKTCKIDEVILPDWFRKRIETFKEVKEFIETATKGKLKYAVVPQAKDPLEWIESYKEMITLDEIDVVCLPIWLQKGFKARPAIAGYLRKKGLWRNDLQYHLLGLDGYGELYAYEPGLIRSVDTSLPFSLTAAGKFDLMFGDSRHSRISMERKPFTKLQSRLLERHINQLLEAASYA